MADNTDNSLLDGAGAGNTDPKPEGDGNKAPEQKPADGKPADGAAANQDPKAGNKDGKDSSKPAGAPEKYADFKLQEGVTLKPEQVTEFTALAKELNLSQEAAQKLVDLQSKNALKFSEESIAGHKQMVEGWKAETQKRLGADMEKQMAFAAKTRDQFGTPALRELLNTTGMANHPDVVDFFIKVGKGMAEDGHQDGKDKSTKSDGALFYPDMK